MAEGEEIDIEGNDSEDEMVEKLYQWAETSKFGIKSRSDLTGTQSPKPVSFSSSPHYFSAEALSEFSEDNWLVYPFDTPGWEVDHVHMPPVDHDHRKHILHDEDDYFNAPHHPPHAFSHSAKAHATQTRTSTGGDQTAKSDKSQQAKPQNSTIVTPVPTKQPVKEYKVETVNNTHKKRKVQKYSDDEESFIHDDVVGDLYSIGNVHHHHSENDHLGNWAISDEDRSVDSTKRSKKSKSEKKKKKERHHSKSHAPTQKAKSSSSVNLPSHNTPWTTQEQSLFEEGLALYGRGSWKEIALHVQTRNSLQVKNHARQYYRKIESPSLPSTSPRLHIANKKLKSKDIVIIKKEEANEDEEIDIGEDDPVMVDSTTSSSSSVVVHSTSTVSEELTHPPSSSHSITTTIPSSVSGKSIPIMATIKSQPMSPATPYDPQSSPISSTEIHGDHSHDSSPPTNHEDIDEKKWMFEAPTEERVLDPKSVISEEEHFNHEFFCGNSVKTPQRYLKIRNGIIEAWKKVKPNYLSKTSVRNTLRDCGDVNAIGRVHEFLELFGAINFGCANKPPSRYRWTHETGGNSNTTTNNNNNNNSAIQFAQYMKEVYNNNNAKRRRKVRTNNGDWMYEEELKREENKTLDHDQPQVIIAPDYPNNNNNNSMKFHHHHHHHHSHSNGGPSDPFRLVACSSFTPEYSQPFQLLVSSNAMLMMDLHSHLVTTEVIGLLGGQYSEHNGAPSLNIRLAIPCNSKSTGIQCEMDPFSEMEAREFLHSQNMEVLGWYHSHVSWAPNPSVRDIESQSNYQVLFANKEKNQELFVGAIVTPYDVAVPTTRSVLNWFWVKRTNNNGELGTPMKLAMSEYDEQLIPSLLPHMMRLIDQYKSDRSRIQFDDLWRDESRVAGVTTLISKKEKLRISLQSKLPNSIDPQDRERFLNTLMDKLSTPEYAMSLSA